MRGTDRNGNLLREGTRHLIYRGPLRIGEIEETTAVYESGRDYGFRIGLSAMCLRNTECRHPTALLSKRFRSVDSAVKSIKQAEQLWRKSLPKDETRPVCGEGRVLLSNGHPELPPLRHEELPPSSGS